MNTWTIIRAAGIGSYVMLFLAIAWGLASTTAPFGKRFAKASASSLHQTMATVGLVLLGLHLLALFADTYMPFSILRLTVPMTSTYRPVAVTFGIVAMYLTVFVVVTSWLKGKIGTKWWRRTHLLAVPTFALALVHGVFAGADSQSPWMYWTYIATGLIVLFLVVVRGLTSGYRPERAPRPERARPVVADEPVAAAVAAPASEG